MSQQVKGFKPSKIVTASGGTEFDLKGMYAIRISAPSEYFINDKSSDKATMPVGASIIDEESTSYTFTNDTVLEVMV